MKTLAGAFIGNLEFSIKWTDYFYPVSGFRKIKNIRPVKWGWILRIGKLVVRLDYIVVEK